MTTENNDDAMVVREKSTPSSTVAETLIDIDNMYSLIGRTKQAVAITTVDGEATG